ncbi:MAG TPA: universal stress protein [Bacteroidia bacterium]|nr:universal stress protein [Bacteroidia bacterium]
METILIATDFSPAAANATEYGIELAKFFDAKIVLVNSYPVPPVGYEGNNTMQMIQALQDSSSIALENLKKQIIAKYQRDFEIECFSDMGFPGDVIAEAAKKYHADLIVMGIIGEAGKIKEHVIGSSSVKVAQHSTVPTFIIPEGVNYHRIRKIAFVCDMDKTEEGYMVYIAKYFGNVFGAELEVVNVEPPQGEMSEAKARTTQFIEKKLEVIKHKTVYVTDNDVAHGLENYFKTHPSDIVMVNPKKHNIFHNLFNESTTKELAFHLHVPLLAIH